MIVQGATDGLASAQGAFKSAKEFVVSGGGAAESDASSELPPTAQQRAPSPEQPEALVAAASVKEDASLRTEVSVEPEVKEVKEEDAQPAVELQKLLKDYDTAVAPPRNSEGVIDMALAFRANKLMTLDHVEQTVTWVGWVRQYWYDPRLEWKSSNGETPFLPVKTDQIWLPDTTLYNAMDFNWGELCDDVDAFILDDSKESKIPVAGVNQRERAFSFTVHQSKDWQQDYKTQLKEKLADQHITEKDFDPKLVVVEDKTGSRLGSGLGFGQPTKEQFPLRVKYAFESMRFNVMWSRPCVLKVKCDIDLKWYPFDTNVCPLQFSPWAYSFLNMHVALGANENVITIPEFHVDILDSQAEWTGYAAAHLNGKKQVQWPSVVVRMQITRHGHYYVVNYICPIMLMVMLTWVSFWIPLQVSDRVSYTVTVVLTVMAVNFITADKRPATDTDMWLDNFQTATLLLVTGATFYTVALHRCGPSEAWSEERIRKRRLLLEHVESFARIIFPVLAFGTLGYLFMELQFGEANNGSEKDFSGKATRLIFACIFFMSCILCCCIGLTMFPQKSFQEKVEQWEEWLSKDKSTQDSTSSRAQEVQRQPQEEILG